MMYKTASLALDVFFGVWWRGGGFVMVGWFECGVGWGVWTRLYLWLV